MKLAAFSLVIAVLTTGCASVVGDVRTFAPVGAASPYAAASLSSPHAAAMQNAAMQNAYAAALPATNAAPAMSSGSIYASTGAIPQPNRGMRLFEDNKARNVGDLLTIVLVERTTSSTNARTSVTKDAGIGLGAPSLFGSPVTYKGKNILQAEVEGSRDFEGAGNSTQSNTLDGSITVTVVQNLGNGNLLVRGQKNVRLNQGDELVQVQGIVRTSDIGPDNRIPSDRVGEAQILYGGRGTIARSNAMGWLGRFFNSAAFPY